MKTAAVLSGDGLSSCGFSSAHVFFVAVFLSQILDHHSHIVFFFFTAFAVFVLFFLQIEIRMEIKKRDKKQSALPKELQETFMTTDSAVLQTKKLNSGEHYADLDTS